MQETETRNTEAPPPPARRALTPLAALGIIAGIALATVASFYVFNRSAKTHVDPISPSRTQQEESLENAYRSLVTNSQLIFRRRDQKLIPTAYTANSPLLPQLSAGLEELTDKNLYDESTFTPLDLEVLEQSRDKAVLREVTEFAPCFRTQDGDDVTDTPGIIEQTNMVTLRRESGRWQIHNSVTIDERLVRKVQSGCEA